MNTKLNKRLKDLEKLKKDLQSSEKSLSKEIMGELKSIMVNNPLLEGIRWAQYTPHFNDGSPCEFGIQEGPDFLFHESIVPSYEEDDNWIRGGEYGSISDEFFTDKSDVLNFQKITTLKKAFEEAEKLVNKLHGLDYALKDMFGDGYLITVTRDGVESEEHMHD